MPNLLSYEAATFTPFATGWDIVAPHTYTQGADHIYLTSYSNYAIVAKLKTPEPVSAGTEYTARATMDSTYTNSARAHKMDIEWLNDADGLVATTLGTAKVDGYVWVTAVAPAGATKARLVLRPTNGGSDGGAERTLIKHAGFAEGPWAATAWEAPALPLSVTGEVAGHTFSALPPTSFELFGALLADKGTITWNALAPSNSVFYRAKTDYDEEIIEDAPFYRNQADDGTSAPAPGFGAKHITPPSLSGTQWSGGGAVEVPGASAAIDVDFTAEFWARPTNVPNPETAHFMQAILGMGQYPNNIGIELRINGPTNAFTFRGFSGEPFTHPYAQIQNQWHHYVVTREGDTVKLYIDKVHWHTGTTTLVGFNDFVIGADYSKWNGRESYFTGDISQIAVYDYALSHERIAAHYDAAFAWNPGPPFSASFDETGEIEYKAYPSDYQQLNPLSLEPTLAAYSAILESDGVGANIVRYQPDSGATPPVAGFGAKKYEEGDDDEDVIILEGGIGKGPKREWTIEFWAKPDPKFANTAITLGNFQFNVHIGEVDEPFYVKGLMGYFEWHSLWTPVPEGMDENDIHYPWGNHLNYKPAFYTDTGLMGWGASDIFSYSPGAEYQAEPGTFAPGTYQTITPTGQDRRSLKLPELHYGNTQGVPFRHNVYDSPEVAKFWHHYVIVKSGDGAATKMALYVDGRLIKKEYPSGWIDRLPLSPSPYEYHWPGDGPYHTARLAPENAALDMTPKDAEGNVIPADELLDVYNFYNVPALNVRESRYTGYLSQITFFDKALSNSQVYQHYLVAMAGRTVGDILIYGDYTAKNLHRMLMPTRKLGPFVPKPPREMIVWQTATRTVTALAPEFKLDTILRAVTATVEYHQFVAFLTLTGDAPTDPITVTAAPPSTRTWSARPAQFNLQAMYVPPPPIIPGSDGPAEGLRVDVSIRTYPIDIGIAT